MSQIISDDHFSDDDFQKKVIELPTTAGSKVLRQALILYVLLKDQDVPNWVKASIIAALGYFIFPFDLIPDFLPGGYIDDCAILLGLVRQLHVYTTAEVLAKANDLLPVWAKEKIN